jgi:hypothetical protein
MKDMKSGSNDLNGAARTPDVLGGTEADLKRYAGSAVGQHTHEQAFHMLA